MMSAERFCHELVGHVPALLPVFDEHLGFEEELVPCTFMGDVARHLYALCDRADDAAWRDVDAILGFAEQGWGDGDKELQVVLFTCLLENLQDFEHQCPAVVDHLGPALRKEFRKICPWAPRKPRRRRGRR